MEMDFIAYFKSLTTKELENVVRKVNGEIKRRNLIKTAKQENKKPDKELFEALMLLRQEISKAQGVTANVIFQKGALEGLAIIRPQTMKEFWKIKGIGINKANKYGKPFLELIKKFEEC